METSGNKRLTTKLHGYPDEAAELATDVDGRRGGLNRWRVGVPMDPAGA